MKASKYRIRKYRGIWCVFMPARQTPVFWGISHAHCVTALPYLHSLTERKRRLMAAVRRLIEED
jgi:hypothetical protein